MTVSQPQSWFASASSTLTSRTVGPPLKLPLATRGPPVPRGAPLRQALLYTVTPSLHIPTASVMLVPPLKLAALSADRTPRRRCRSGTQADASRIK